jgi:hypothetical protein
MQRAEIFDSCNSRKTNTYVCRERNSHTPKRDSLSVIYKLLLAEKMMKTDTTATFAMTGQLSIDIARLLSHKQNLR